MVSGSTADRIGRRRMFQTGLSLFSLGSLLCALAPSLGLLIAARVLQAIGGSMLNPVALSIVRNVFTDPRERAKAIGVWGGAVGISMALGPVLGGALVDGISWRAVFVVNVPVGLLAILLTALFVPESRAAHARRIDPVGQLLVITGLATLTYGIIQAPGAGWLSAQTLALFAVAFTAFASVIVYELRRFEPLLEVRFFASAPFSAATAIAVAQFAALGGLLLLTTLYLQDVRRLSPLDAGLCMAPMAGLMVIVAPLTGRAVPVRGTRAPIAGGSLAVIVSGLILTQVTATTPYAHLLVAYALFGIGMGMVNPAITITAVSGMPPSQAGVAAAVASTGRQVGVTLGVAVLGAIAGEGAVAGAIGPGFLADSRTCWWIVVGLGATILAMGLLSTTAWADATARRTAERFREPDEPGGAVGTGGALALPTVV
jgi:EmrB/QacA subfamily drug resistance transporter